MIVLIVEDEWLLALALHDALLRAGHTILGSVDNLHDAVALAALQSFDLALLNIDLPGAGSGIELARHLKRQHGIPSLFVSGSATQARANRDAALGLVREPYDLGHLLAILRFAERLIGAKNRALCRPGWSILAATGARTSAWAEAGRGRAVPWRSPRRRRRPGWYC